MVVMNAPTGEAAPVRVVNSSSSSNKSKPACARTTVKWFVLCAAVIFIGDGFMENRLQATMIKSLDLSSENCNVGVIAAATATASSNITSQPAAVGGQSVSSSTRTDLLASQQSFGFFNDVPDTVWHRVRDYAQTVPQWNHPLRHSAGTQEPWRWYMDNLIPTLACQHMQRVGGLGDGPKYVCDPHRLAQREDCLIYSIGSNGLYNFEDELYRMHPHCEIHTFDFGKFQRRGESHLQYHQWGLGSSYYPSYNAKYAKDGHIMKTFPEIVKELGHENRIIDLFKIDCEGCEWVTYKDWVGHPNLRQIQIEVHGMTTKKTGFVPTIPQQPVPPIEIYEMFQQHNFAMFSKELNPWTNDCYEFSYLKMAPEFWQK